MKDDQEYINACLTIAKYMTARGEGRVSQFVGDMGRIHISIDAVARPSSSARWIPAEHDFIRTHAATVSPIEMAKALGRSVDAVRVRASMLGVRLERKGPQYDMRVADRLAGKIPAKDIAERIGCNVSTVQKYIVQNDLPRMKKGGKHDRK